MKNLSLFVILFLSLNLEAQNKDSIEVVQATNKFLKAFSDFDWETFKNCFANDASIFFPGEYAQRKIGKIEIETSWKELFPEFIDKSKKFDLQLNPQNIVIQLYDKSAVVTFHLKIQSDYLSRRTLVFIKEKESWKIVHLHASSLKEKK